MVRLFTLAIVVLAGLMGSVDAGVRGGRFQGTINSEIGNSAEATLDFAAIGDERMESQSIGGIANEYPGTYCEFELGIFSYWTGTFTGAATFEASGFSVFNVFTTYSLTNNDQPAASGWLIRTGAAVIE